MDLGQKKLGKAAAATLGVKWNGNMKPAATTSASHTAGRSESGSGSAAGLSVDRRSGSAAGLFSVRRGSGPAALLSPNLSNNGAPSLTVNSSPIGSFTTHDISGAGFPLSPHPSPALGAADGGAPMTSSFGHSDATWDEDTQGSLLRYFGSQPHNFHLVGAPSPHSNVSAPVHENNGGSSPSEVELLSEQQGNPVTVIVEEETVRTEKRIILHNMIVEDEKEAIREVLDLNENASATIVLPPEVRSSDNPNPSFAEALRVNSAIKARPTHRKLKKDLIDHIWQCYGNKGN